MLLWLSTVKLKRKISIITRMFIPATSSGSQRVTRRRDSVISSRSMMIFSLLRWDPGKKSRWILYAKKELVKHMLNGVQFAQPIIDFCQMLESLPLFKDKTQKTSSKCALKYLILKTSVAPQQPRSLILEDAQPAVSVLGMKDLLINSIWAKWRMCLSSM